MRRCRLRRLRSPATKKLHSKYNHITPSRRFFAFRRFLPLSPFNRRYCKPSSEPKLYWLNPLTVLTIESRTLQLNVAFADLPLRECVVAMLWRRSLHQEPEACLFLIVCTSNKTSSQSLSATVRRQALLNMGRTEKYLCLDLLSARSLGCLTRDAARPDVFPSRDIAMQCPVGQWITSRCFTTQHASTSEMAYCRRLTMKSNKGK
jgi:hypothetical protein